MEKAYSFLQKLIVLAINTLIFFAIEKYIPYYFSLPLLLIIFGVITSRIVGSSPKELYDFARSEKYFAKGGLRDLLRVPVVLVAFIHNIIVWLIWGVYQIFVLLTETIQFLKELVYYIFYGILWFLKLFIPFWRIIYKLIIYYLIKWPWWIYRYAFKAVSKTYNWNILKISALGSFIALLLIHLFYFLDVTLNIDGLIYIGLILALLPIAWTFAEIASIRGQKLMFVPFREVRYKLRNGLETVRGLLFFITFFVVILLAQAGLNLLGWISNAGIFLLGISININFVLNIALIILGFIIIFSTFVLPTYRLYNDFNETIFKNVYSLLKQILKRILQYLAGFIPASFFSTITIIPASLMVALAFFVTIQIKDSIINIKTEKLITEQANATDAISDYKLRKKIDRLEQSVLFPRQFYQEIQHRTLLKREIEHYKSTRKERQLELADYQAQTNKIITDLEAQINTEQEKPVINQTRLDALTQDLSLIKKRYQEYESNYNNEMAMLDIDIEYANLRHRQLPVLFYLSGFIVVVVLTLVLTFFLAYFGNFFYKAFLYKNDESPARWKSFIAEEQYIDKKQPLLSTSLNIILLIAIAFSLNYLKVFSLLF